MTALTTEQAAAHLGVSPRWLADNRDLIPYVRLGVRLVRYRVSDLEAYLEANRVTGLAARRGALVRSPRARRRSA